MSDLVVARNCCMARMLLGETELVPVGMNRAVREGKKCFERSDGLDTALCMKTGDSLLFILP